jgi:hypothetical protein
MTICCRGCEEPITAENDSEAHIIPNALGGRLAPKGIICRTCNTALDGIADNALIEAFGDWPTLLDIPRQRGKNPPKVIETRDGHRVRLKADGSLTRTDIQYDVSAVPDGQLVQIGAGDMRTFRQLLNRAAADFPQFDPLAAQGYARTVGVLENDLLKMSLDFSPQAVFGGAISAIWLYLILKTGRAFMDWNHLLACIKAMQTHGGKFRYFVNDLPGLRGPRVDLGHKLIVRSVPSTGELIAYAEVLGMLKVGGLFARSPNPGYVLEHIYAYDLLGKTERSSEFSIDGAEFDRQNWRSVGLGATDAEALRDHFKGALNIFVDHYKRRFSAKGTGSAEPPSSK